MATSSDYEYTDDCREISGFGGDYEEACRAMVIAGVEWLDDHPNADPVIKTVKNVTGISIPENSDAEEFQEAMVDAACEVDDGGPTGAMVQYATAHALWAYENGWDEYVAEMESGRNE